MLIKEYALPGRVILHTVYNGKIITDEIYYNTIRHEFPDPGQAMQHAANYSGKVPVGKYTHIYFHNKLEIEIDENTTDSNPKYPKA